MRLKEELVAERMPNMGFLWKLILESGVSKASICEKLGMSYQNLYAMFVRDDLKLSLVKEIINILGYDFVLFYYKEGKSTEKLVTDFETTVNSIIPETMSVARLTFLHVAMKVYNLSRKDVTDAIGVAPGQLSRIFAADDIFMSYLFRIAEKCDLQLKMRLLKRESNVQLPSNTSLEII